MNPIGQSRVGDYSADYATHADFCRAFAADMSKLHLLAFLLTASHLEAERCLIDALEQVPKNMTVFKHWVRSWTKRTLITIAISRVLWESRGREEVQDRSGRRQCEGGVPHLLNAVTWLPPLERFVFVMSVLEDYSIKECSLLLDCCVEVAIKARIHALSELPWCHSMCTEETREHSSGLGAIA